MGAGDACAHQLEWDVPWYSHLDCYSTPVDCITQYGSWLQPGLLARAGWTLTDDATTLRYAGTRAGTISGAGTGIGAGAGGRPTDWPPAWRPQTALAFDSYFHAYGSDYVGALAEWAALSGPPALPPRAAFGVWWSQNYPWNMVPGDPDNFADTVLAGYANHSLPLTVAVLDMDWHARVQCDGVDQEWGSYDWNATAFPSAASFAAQLHTVDSGVGHPLALVLNIHPQNGIFPCETRYKQVAAALGLDPASRAAIPCDFGNGSVAEATFGLYLSPPPLDAVDAYWTDYNGCMGARPSAAAAANMLAWSNSVFGAAQASTRGRRPWLLSRYGGLGGQRSPIAFSGDTFQHELTLAYQIATTATSSNALMPFWSHDVGGFHANFSKDGGLQWTGDSDPRNATGACLYVTVFCFRSLCVRDHGMTMIVQSSVHVRVQYVHKTFTIRTQYVRLHCRVPTRVYIININY